MPLKRLHHVQLAMPPDKEADARAFYAGVLGLREIAKPPNLMKRGGCWFSLDDVAVHLGTEVDFRPARKAHPAFLVEDLPALQSRVQAAGYPTRTDEPLEGFNRIYIDDPFGNRIELLEPAQRSSIP